MTNIDVATLESGELWNVLLPSGEILALTLNQLDAAFQEETIDAQAMVRQPRSLQWENLGALLGLDTPADSLSRAIDPTQPAPALGSCVEIPTPVCFELASRASLAVEIDVDVGPPPAQPRPSMQRAAAWVAAAALALVGLAIVATKVTSAPGLDSATSGAEGPARLVVREPVSVQTTDQAPAPTEERHSFEADRHRAPLRKAPAATHGTPKPKPKKTRSPPIHR